MQKKSDNGNQKRALPKTMEEFWELTKYSWSLAEHQADKFLQSLATADADRLKIILVQYRMFTGFFPGDLAILASKLPPSSLRTFIGSLIDEELGSKDKFAHLALYDRFLMGLGVTSENVRELTNPLSISLMESMRLKLQQNSAFYGIGMRGMGGECLCQVYLSTLHDYLIKNPLIEQLKSSNKIDWAFWDLHAGEDDEEHSIVMRKRIEEVVTSSQQLSELCQGYIDAEYGWRLFWHTAFGSPDSSAWIGFGRRKSRSEWMPSQPSDCSIFAENQLV